MYYSSDTCSTTVMRSEGGFAHGAGPHHYITGAKSSPSEIPDEPRDPEIEPDWQPEPTPDFNPEIMPDPAPEILPDLDDPEFEPLPEF